MAGRQLPDEAKVVVQTGDFRDEPWFFVAMFALPLAAGGVGLALDEELAVGFRMLGVAGALLIVVAYARWALLLAREDRVRVRGGDDATAGPSRSHRRAAPPRMRRLWSVRARRRQSKKRSEEPRR